MTKMYAEMLDEIRANIVSELNRKTEIKIIMRMENGVFPTHFMQKPYRELCEVQINQRYEWDKNKLSNLYFGRNPFDYGMAVDDFLFEEIDNYLYDFIEDCVAKKKYFELLQEKLDFSGDEDDYRDSVVEFFCEFNFEKGIYQEHDTLPLWQENPTIEEIYKKHSVEINAWNTAYDKWQQDRDNHREFQMQKANKIYIPENLIGGHITKNDTEFNYLKQNYTKEELALLLFAGKFTVSNSTRDKYANFANVSYPIPSPKLENFFKN